MANKVAERVKRETFCIACGMPISRAEMGLTAADTKAAEWQDCLFANVTLHFCTLCWNERKQWLTEGIRGAVEREERALKDGSTARIAGNYT